ncbi:MAG: MFS transporter [Actinomycetota bacterium]
MHTGPQSRASAWAFGISLVGFVVLGLTDGAIGTVWPDLRDDFGRTDGSFGQLFGCLAGGYLVASVVSGHLSDRFGTAFAFRCGSGTAAVALAVIATGSSWSTTLVGFAILGLGNGLLDSTINAWVAVKRGQRAMGLLHAFYGVGASAGPLVATVFVAGGDRWEIPFWIFAGIQVAVLLVSPLAREGLDDLPVSADVAAAQEHVATGSRWLLPMVLAWFFLYVGVEVSMGQWSFTLLSEARGVDEVAAGFLVASYWGGLTAGRFLLAFVGDTMTPEAIMSRASSLSIVALVVFALDPGGVGAAALPVAGFAFSVMFPAVVNRTPIYLGADRAARIVGYQLAASSAGAIVVPALIGVLTDRTSPEALGWVGLGVVLAMSAMWALVRASAPRATAAGEIA